MKSTLYWELNTSFGFIENSKIVFTLTRDKVSSLSFYEGSEIVNMSMEDSYNKAIRISNEYAFKENYGSDCYPINEYETSASIIGWDCQMIETLKLIKGSDYVITGISEDSQKIKKDFNLVCDKTLWKIDIKFQLILSDCDECCEC